MECTSQSKRFGFIATAAAAALALTVGLGAIGAPNAYGVTAAEKAAEAEEALTQLYAMQDTLEETSQKYYQSLMEYQQATERCDAAQ